MKKELKILLTVSGISRLAAGLFGPIYAIFVEDIGGDILTASGAYGAFAVSAGLLMLLCSHFEDRIKRTEYLIIASYGLSAVGFAGYLLIERPIHLFIVQIIFGISESIGTPAYDGMYSHNLEKGKFISQWGLWDGMSWFTTGISAIAGGFIAAEFGFPILFYVMLSLAIVSFGFSFLLLRTKKLKNGHRKRITRE